MTEAGSARVRRARVADLAHLADLASEHAAYEGATPPPTDLARRLATLLFRLRVSGQHHIPKACE